MTLCHEMKAPVRLLFFSHFAMFTIGCSEHSENSDAQLLNTRVTIDFSSARGEDPASFIKALRPKLDHFDFPVRRPEFPDGLGQVWVEVQDDNLTETFKAFEQSLAEAGDPYTKEIVIDVRTSEENSTKSLPKPTTPR